MKTVEEARKRWHSLFSGRSSLAELKQELKSKDGDKLCQDGLRSVCWKAFLVHQNLDTASWPAEISNSRTAYQSLREHFLRYIEHPDDLPSTADPLAEDDESPWQTLRRDETIRAEIYQDVERCMQENYFFREPKTKARMLDILFIYTKLNADLGYRQGMHELLAPVLWVVEHDAIDKKTTVVSASDTGSEDLMLQVLDMDYMEHDAFTIFCAIMQTAKLFYEQEAGRVPGVRSDVSPIVSRSEHIHQALLRAVDPELADHLQITEILPQIFLTRWIRLLFGREFSFHEVLNIWDVLFAENMRLELIDDVCVAMLLRIRWQLLDADYSSALALLLRYPAPIPYKPVTFVEDGLFLEKHLNCEGATLLIQKYSGKVPDPNKQYKPPSLNAVPQFSSRRKKKPTTREPSNAPNKVPSPSLSPVQSHQRRLDSLFQDVSQGLHRRTEGWGVTKVVRGAMVEARRNIQNIQSSASTPAPRRTESPPHDSPSPPHVSLATVRRLNARISALESRSQALAGMLGDAINELRTQQEDPNKSNTKAIDLALAKMQFVQVYLADPTMPILDERKSTTQAAARARSSDPVFREHVTKPAAAVSKENNNPNGERKLEKKPACHALPKTRDAESADIIKPVPLRPAARAARAPIAQSPFSWMLGDSKERSGFVTSVSAPPEQSRSIGTLFGDNRGDVRKLAGDEEDGVVLNSLRGIASKSS
ncbi:TBC domain-containing protein [Blastomyces gilchristii SLH14081]|uniref:TBC domain-containing protein n=1 Tax=Blastomyces gilchristii (strain SLH14081) TaxID=559298 RepID=A0A179UKX7_BLAGS|nr:TBC domain-containing protein [Blastomyces gilchristii SLH14081]OAT08726.1 TBC domain-containing protein [Blastomyces gilchristii SLH14081]